MTDKEILAELKIAYENINDIRENGCADHCNGQLSYNCIERLNRIKEDLEFIYWSVYRKIDKKELEITIYNGNKLYYNGYVSDSVNGDYVSYDENEDAIYKTCEDLSYYWYEDKYFLES